LDRHRKQVTWVTNSIMPRSISSRQTYPP
jgi:hypothetical protein